VTALLVGTALTTLGSLPAEASSTVDSLSRYCTACWRNARLQPDAWADCTQEVLVRLVQRIPTSSWNRILSQDSEEHREFVRAIDAVKKRTMRARRPAALDADVADPRDYRASVTSKRDWLLRAADEHLSSRQARILSLSLDGWSVAEMASELELPAQRVSDEKYKAIQKLRGVLQPDDA